MKKRNFISTAALLLSASALTTPAIADTNIEPLAASTANIPEGPLKITLSYYHYLLKARVIDSEGVNYWVNEINNRGCNITTLRDVIWSFTTHAKFTDQIDAIDGSAKYIELMSRLYLAALRRVPTTQELTQWVPQLVSGLKNKDDIINHLHTQAEFKQVTTQVCGG